jgi:hypothetical protein
MKDEYAIKAAIGAVLEGDTLAGAAYARGVATIVGVDAFDNVRVYLDMPDVAPEELENLEAWEAVSFDIVDFTPANRDGSCEAIVQIDAWSKDKDTVDEIGSRIGDLLQDQPLVVEGMRVDFIREQHRMPLFDETLKVHRKMVQYRVLAFVTT